ncbi:MAG: CarD family transcriptional regulator [Bacillota bacterium]
MGYQIGDRVVYPRHGAGIVEAVEEREVAGQRQTYYVIRLPFEEMTVMVPSHYVDELGLRPAIEEHEVERVLAILGARETEVPATWADRYRTNLEKIRTGDIYAVAEVVRDLAEREKTKGLSGGERRMLEYARQILCSELALAQNLTREEAENMVSDRLLLH